MGKIKTLLDTRLINVSVLAEGIYPQKKHAGVYLNQKIKGISGLKLTKEDELVIGNYLKSKIKL